MTREEAIFYLTPIAESASLERYKEALGLALSALQNQPVWIPVADVVDCCYRCSECQFLRDAYLLDIGNYCPNCGARMDLEEPNETKET